MKFSTTGKAWFGLQLYRAARTFLDERKKYRERVAYPHGYGEEQRKDIIVSIFTRHPDLANKLMSVSPEERAPEIDAFFSMDPTRFREVFGFERAPPWPR